MPLTIPSGEHHRGSCRVSPRLWAPGCPWTEIPVPVNPALCPYRADSPGWDSPDQILLDASRAPAAAPGFLCLLLLLTQLQRAPGPPSTVKSRFGSLHDPWSYTDLVGTQLWLALGTSVGLGTGGERSSDSPKPESFPGAVPTPTFLPVTWKQHRGKEKTFLPCRIPMREGPTELLPVIQGLPISG